MRISLLGKIGRILLRTLVKLLILFIGITVLWVMIYRIVNPPITSLMITKWWTNDYTITKEWKDVSLISSYLQLAVIASEDQLFFQHSGFDWEAIGNAIEFNSNGNRKRGASTISQQVAKNVFLWPSRTWLRKGLEVYFTFLIEAFWGKQRILEVYLNVIEWGKGVYGSQAASKKYYNINSLDLNPNQAALLAAVVPNPIKYSVEKPTPYILKRKRWIVRQMRNLGGVAFVENNLE